MKKFSFITVSLLMFLSFGAFSQEQENEERIRIGFAEFENKAFAVEKVDTYYGDKYRETQFSMYSFLDMVSTALVKTRRFECLERSRLDALLQEQGMAQAGLIDPETAAKSGQLKGVHFLLTGTVDTAGIDTQTIQTRGYAQKIETFRFGASFKLIDAQTGRIVMSEFVDMDQKISAPVVTKNYASTSSSQTYISDVLRKAALQVGFLVANAIDPVVVTAVSGKSVKINYGAGFIEEGQVYKVFPEGEMAEVNDLGFDEVARVRIKTVRPTESYAEVVEGDENNIFEGFSCQKLSLSEESEYLSNEEKKKRDDLGNRFGY